MPFQIRRGSAADTDTVLGLFDAAVRWQVGAGLSSQWGTTPFSAEPQRVDAVARWAAGDGLHLCENAGEPVGALVLGDAPSYVLPAVADEVYVVALVTARSPQARGAGRLLLDVADEQARARGADLLRVDCFAGNDGALVRYYEAAGYRRTVTFDVGDWPGQVLERRL